MRCRCPPDSVMPCSPIRVSSPHGRSCTNCACATSSASSTSWSVASALPRRRSRGRSRRTASASSKPTATWRRSDRSVDVADVDAVDRHPAVRHVVETRHEHRQRGLARAGEPDERDRLARLDLEVDVAAGSSRRSRGSGSRRASNRTSPGDVRRASRVLGRVLHARVAVEHLEHALGRGRRLLGHPEDPAERLDGPDDHQEVAHERDQAAERHRPARRPRTRR